MTFLRDNVVSSTVPFQSVSKKNKIGNERDLIVIHFAFWFSSCRDWDFAWFLSVSNFSEVWSKDYKIQITLAWLCCCNSGAGVVLSRSVHTKKWEGAEVVEKAGELLKDNLSAVEQREQEKLKDQQNQQNLWQQR